MTTEDDFQAALDADPNDHNTRMVFADFLDERGDPRAAGYRALGALRLHTRAGTGFWWCNGAVYTARPTHENLPPDWFGELEAQLQSITDRKSHGCLQAAKGLWYTFQLRRLSDDAAAHAFGKLRPERRAELLTAEPDRQ
jgi:uncharacterized protein (TIGR02996 family)